MIHLMLVDDHAMLREGLRSKFETCPDTEIVAEAGTLAQAVRHLSSIKPDVIILDLKLPDGNGSAIIKQLKELHPNCRIVVLTMYNHVRYVQHALESGADGFVVKGAPFEELKKAVHQVFKHRTYVCSSLASEFINAVAKDAPKSELDLLSSREFEALTLLSSGLSLKEAAARMKVSEKTVSTYQARFMQKLNLANRTDLIRFALEHGLLN